MVSCDPSLMSTLDKTTSGAQDGFVSNCASTLRLPASSSSPVLSDCSAWNVGYGISDGSAGRFAATNTTTLTRRIGPKSPRSCVRAQDGGARTAGMKRRLSPIMSRPGDKQA